jgi:hypothetical protein
VRGFFILPKPATAKKPTMSIGFGGPGYGDTGRIVWQDADEPRQHSRITIEHISEQEDLRRRGLL